MKSIHRHFSNELNNLTQFIDFGISSAKYFSSAKIQGDSIASNFNLGKNKIYNYNSYIITLYGLFERFIENLTTKYIQDICASSKSYNQLPEVIQTNNLKKSAELFLLLSLPKNQSLDSKKLVEILNKNLSEKSPLINHQAFTQHSSNFRQNSINEYLKQIGINNLSSEIRNISPLKEKLEMEFRDFKNQKSDIIFSFINDLAERRNDVAHGVENISLLHPNVIKEYINSIQIYSTSLYAFMNSKLLEFRFKHELKPLKKINVIDNRILLCELNKIKINKASKIIVERTKSHPKYIEVGITQIQKDKIEIEGVDGTENVNLGIEVNGIINRKNNFALKE